MRKVELLAPAGSFESLKIRVSLDDKIIVVLLP